jgi:hypothetical protein
MLSVTTHARTLSSSISPTVANTGAHGIHLRNRDPARLPLTGQPATPGPPAPSVLFLVRNYSGATTPPAAVSPSGGSSKDDVEAAGGTTRLDCDPRHKLIHGFSITRSLGTFGTFGDEVWLHSAIFGLPAPFLSYCLVSTMVPKSRCDIKLKRISLIPSARSGNTV